MDTQFQRSNSPKNLRLSVNSQKFAVTVQCINAPVPVPVGYVNELFCKANAKLNPSGD